MRTTVRLDDDLLNQAKRYAAEHGTTLTAMLDQALREILSRSEHRTRAEAVQLPSFEGNGLQPGVDLDNSESLLDLMDRQSGSS